MKKLQRLTKNQRIFLKKNGFNEEKYLLERNVNDGIIFVDRLITHKLCYDKKEKVFTRFEIRNSDSKEGEEYAI